jgi:asparaginyl-tRNA synthetase
MSELSVRDLLSGKIAAGSDVTLKGWVRTRRDSKQGFSFINLHDGSCFDAIQVVADKSMPGYQEDVLHLTTGCAIVATGKLVESKGRGQSFEVQAHGIEVLGWVDDPDTYPVSAKRHTFEHLREVAHLRPRTNTIGAIARLRHSLAQAVHRYMSEHGFVWIHTPIITASDCEGAGELFRVSTLDFANIPRDAHDKPDFSADFFGREAFLTVSGQLNVECYCLALSKVYTFGPTFRAENSNTSRHLAEFWMVEPEIAFCDLHALADLAEDFLKSVFTRVRERCPDDLAFFDQRIDDTVLATLNHVIESPFERITYSDAVTILEQSGRAFDFPVSWGADLQSEHERFLTEEHFRCPIIVTDYPRGIKAFYMYLNDDEKTVAAMDVLVPRIGEIVGGSQREHREDVLLRRLADQGLSADRYWWYLDLRRHGSVPHAGFGLGFERMVQFMTGMANIRDVIPFPRVPGNAEF